jgi:hypothetical protein
MDPLRFQAETHGFFTRAQAHDCGVTDKQVASAVRCRGWLRLRRGYFTFPDLWAELDELARFRVRGAMAMDSLGPSVALSHVSSLAEHEIAMWGLPTDRVHVTRLDGGAGRIEAGVIHHEGFSLADDVTSVNGLRVMAPVRSALEACIRADNEVALSVLDSLLHQEHGDSDSLMDQFKVMQHWPGIRHLHIPVRMADGRSASPGESRGRWLCWACGLPAPELQYAVHDVDGTLLGTTDWAWPEDKLLGEFDGRVKYGRLLQPGQEPGEVVFAEKQREDRLREVTGFGMVRLTWADYDVPTLTAGRIRRQLSRVS